MEKGRILVCVLINLWCILLCGSDIFPFITNARPILRWTITFVYFLLLLFLCHFTQIQVLLWLEIESVFGSCFRHKLHFLKQVRKSQDLRSMDRWNHIAFEIESCSLEHEFRTLAQKMHLWESSIQGQTSESSLRFCD